MTSLLASEASWRNMRATAIDLRKTTLHASLIKICQTNPWLKVGGVDFEDDFCLESDYPYGLERYEDLGMLRRFLEHDNWSIRTAVTWEDLVFVNQVNGGDEWWTLKILPDGSLLPFESITFGPSIKNGTFPGLLACLTLATAAQCRSLDYMEVRQHGS